MLVYKGLQLLFADRAFVGSNKFASLEQSQGGYAFNVAVFDGFGVGIDFDLDDLEAIAVAVGEGGDRWRHQKARAAPRSPEIS